MNHMTATPREQPAPPIGRRSFFQWITILLGLVASALVAVPFIGYLLNWRSRTPPWINLGALDGFPLDQTLRVTFENPLRQPWDGITAEAAVFVRNEGTNAAGEPAFRVLGQNCAHLGCPVSWFPQSGLFMCPCHGGVYYETGEHASGPPPRGLFHCVWRVKDGQLEIQAPHYPTLQDTLEDRALG
jgi:nitrite reductase/ring-hydroxylating ferredoxin subunit